MMTENKLPFPVDALKKVLPADDTMVKLGEENFSKIEYQGKAYIIRWTPAIHITATATFEDFDREIAILNERKAAIDNLVKNFNELKATPVAVE
jgi:hypothetical protein